jgi:FAD/FMN-containing dehydrogenase
LFTYPCANVSPGCAHEPTPGHHPANKRRHQPSRSPLRHGRTRWRWQLPLYAPPLSQSSLSPSHSQLLAILLFNESERKIAEDVVHRMVKRAVEMEGTVTGEHGVGLIKRDYLTHELGESTVDAMRRVGSKSFLPPIKRQNRTDM